jgi:hypothetical protein
MSRAQRHIAGIFILLVSLVGTAGCVSIPTTGPIEKVEGQQPPCQNCVNVQVAPPAPGAEPKEIVEGYLRATSNYRPNYSVARQFLTPMAAEKWSPDIGVSIYRGSPKATQVDQAAVTSTVNLDKGWLVGSLSPDRTYAAGDRELKINFHLSRENGGEWRIENPPPGLMVAEVSFNFFYQPYNLYFVGNGKSLVPDPIYLPALINPANVASALMKALLKGPSGWLKPAVSSAIPPNTSLSVESVTITDGIAEVSLSDSVLALPDPQRSLLAAQVVYTLRQVGGVKGVLIKVNQQPYRVPGSDPHTLAILTDAIPRDVDPIPSVADKQLYAVQDGAIKKINKSDSPGLSALNGPLGHGAYLADALAVSVTNADLAFTANGRKTLYGAPTATGQPALLLKGATDLLRPQFTRYGEIWDIGRQGGKQRLWMFAADEKGYKKVEIDSPVVRDQNVTAFKISPDGTRMALVRSTRGASELGLARIIRSGDVNKITVDNWRRLNTTQTMMLPIRIIKDVAWIDATELLLLGAPDPDTAVAPFRVVEDASRITPQGEPETRDAAALAVLPGTQTAVIVGRDGRTWKYDGNQWTHFVDKIRAIAYPG